MDNKVFERLKEVAWSEFGVALTKVEYIEERKLIAMINILREHGATKDEIKSEIEHREKTRLVDSPKCFAYRTLELKNVLEYWDKF